MGIFISVVTGISYILPSVFRSKSLLIKRVIESAALDIARPSFIPKLQIFESRSNWKAEHPPFKLHKLEQKICDLKQKVQSQTRKLTMFLNLSTKAPRDYRMTPKWKIS